MRIYHNVAGTFFERKKAAYFSCLKNLSCLLPNNSMLYNLVFYVSYESTFYFSVEDKLFNRMKKVPPTSESLTGILRNHHLLKKWILMTVSSNFSNVV